MGYKNFEGIEKKPGGSRAHDHRKMEGNLESYIGYLRSEVMK